MTHGLTRQQSSFISLFIFTPTHSTTSFDFSFSLCAEKEIRGNDDKSIVLITRLCVYYSELEIDIQSSALLFGLVLFFGENTTVYWKYRVKKKGHN